MHMSSDEKRELEPQEQGAEQQPQAAPQAVRNKQGKDLAGGKVDRMGSGSIGKLLIEFSIPATLSMVVNGLYNILSAIFLGQGIGDIGLAVSTVANPMMMLFMALGMFIGVGGNALAAIRLGEGRKAEAERVLGNTVTLGIIVYVVTCFFAFVLIDPILAVSGATEETWELSRVFLQIIAVGSIFQILGMGVNNFIRTAGDPTRALWTMIIGAVMCTIMSFLFVMVLGWGVPGMALATIVGQFTSFCVVFHYFLFNKKCPFKLKASNLKFVNRAPLTILALGTASLFTQLAMVVVSFVLNNVIYIYGAEAAIGENGVFAAFAVVQRIAMFVMFPVMGIAVGAQPMLGYNFGARNPMRVKNTLKLELKSALVCCLIMFTAIELAAPSICVLFGVSEGVLDFAIFTLRIQTMLMPIMVFQIIIANYYQATGRPSLSAFLSLTRQLLIMTPLYVVLPLLVGAVAPGTERIVGVLFAPPTADLFSFVIAICFVIYEFRKLNRYIKLEEQGLPSGYGPSFKGDKPRDDEAQGESA